MRSNHCCLNHPTGHQHRTCDRAGSRIGRNKRNVAAQPTTQGVMPQVEGKPHGEPFPQGTPLPKLGMFRKRERIEMLNDGYLWSVENDEE